MVLNRVLFADTVGQFFLDHKPEGSGLVHAAVADQADRIKYNISVRIRIGFHHGILQQDNAALHPGRTVLSGYLGQDKAVLSCFQGVMRHYFFRLEGKRSAGGISIGKIDLARIGTRAGNNRDQCASSAVLDNHFFFVNLGIIGPPVIGSAWDLPDHIIVGSNGIIVNLAERIASASGDGLSLNRFVFNVGINGVRCFIQPEGEHFFGVCAAFDRFDAAESHTGSIQFVCVCKLRLAARRADGSAHSRSGSRTGLGKPGGKLGLRNRVGGIARNTGDHNTLVRMKGHCGFSVGVKRNRCIGSFTGSVERPGNRLVSVVRVQQGNLKAEQPVGYIHRSRQNHFLRNLQFAHQARVFKGRRRDHNTRPVFLYLQGGLRRLGQLDCPVRKTGGFFRHRIEPRGQICDHYTVLNRICLHVQGFGFRSLNLSFLKGYLHRSAFSGRQSRSGQGKGILAIHQGGILYRSCSDLNCLGQHKFAGITGIGVDNRSGIRLDRRGDVCSCSRFSVDSQCCSGNSHGIPVNCHSRFCKAYLCAQRQILDLPEIRFLSCSVSADRLNRAAAGCGLQDLGFDG